MTGTVFKKRVWTQHPLPLPLTIFYVYMYICIRIYVHLWYIQNGGILKIPGVSRVLLWAISISIKRTVKVRKPLFASRGTQCQDDWYQKFLDGVAENYRRIVVPAGNLRWNGIEHRDIGHVFMISLDDFRCVEVYIYIYISYLISTQP